MASLLGQTDILSLPNEILAMIIELVYDQTYSSERFTRKEKLSLIPNLRLTCTRFCDLSSHLLLKKVHVDISQTETLTRLENIAARPNIARGIREVYVRLHFYHPWVARSLGNFIAAVKSEWQQRTHAYPRSNIGPLGFDEIAKEFLKALPQSISETGDKYASSELSEEGNGESPRRNTSSSLRPIKVCKEAYDIYRSRFEAQQRVMTDFSTNLAQHLSRLVNFTSFTLHDRELYNNWDPGSQIRIGQADYQAQEDALVNVFSCPMLWEDAQWIQPAAEISSAVPINLLVDIPLAIAERRDIYISHFSVQVSAAPNYSQLPTGNQETKVSLAAAMEQMDIFQFDFQPCCRSGCGPWVEPMSPSTGISVHEMEALDGYLGAITNNNSIEYYDINLGELWISAGVDSIQDLPSFLGRDWFSSPRSQVSSVNLNQVPLRIRDFERLVNLVCDDGEIRLDEIFFYDSTWNQVWDILEKKKPKLRALYTSVMRDIDGWVEPGRRDWIP